MCFRLAPDCISKQGGQVPRFGEAPGCSPVLLFNPCAGGTETCLHPAQPQTEPCASAACLCCVCEVTGQGKWARGRGTRKEHSGSVVRCRPGASLRSLRQLPGSPCRPACSGCASGLGQRHGCHVTESWKMSSKSGLRWIVSAPSLTPWSQHCTYEGLTAMQRAATALSLLSLLWQAWLGAPTSLCCQGSPCWCMVLEDRYCVTYFSSLCST